MPIKVIPETLKTSLHDRPLSLSLSLSPSDLPSISSSSPLLHLLQALWSSDVQLGCDTSRILPGVTLVAVNTANG